MRIKRFNESIYDNRVLDNSYRVKKEDRQEFTVQEINHILNFIEGLHKFVEHNVEYSTFQININNRKDKKSEDDLGFFIYKLVDEWYYVSYYKYDNNPNNSIKEHLKYKCDSLGGLMEVLNQLTQFMQQT